MTLEVMPLEAVSGPAAKMIEASHTRPMLGELLTRAQSARQKYAEDLRQLAPYVADLSGSEAREVYQKVIWGEEQLAAPHRLHDEYGTGVASFGDELCSIGSGAVLMESQHATDPWRKDSSKREAADHGTAGLGFALADHGLGRLVTPLGRQRSNANTASDSHPLKQRLVEHMEEKSYKGFLSLHGCKPGKVTNLLDHTEIHGVIGLGKNPRKASIEAAEALVAGAASEYGLRLVTGNKMPQLNFTAQEDASVFWDLTHELLKDENGQPKAARLAALMQNSTASFMTRQTEDTPGFPVMQLELSRSLRLTPKDRWVRPNHSAGEFGVYLGYCVSRLAAGIIAGE